MPAVSDQFPHKKGDSAFPFSGECLRRGIGKKEEPNGKSRSALPFLSLRSSPAGQIYTLRARRSAMASRKSMAFTIRLLPAAERL